jgi:hypothetical protein
MRTRYLFALFILSVTMIPGTALAALFFKTSLAGSNEVPANASPGTGTATILINDALDTITISASFAGLTAGTAAAHIHCCTSATANTGVAIETPSLPGFPLGVTSGSFSNSFNLLDANNYNAPFVTANGGTAIGARDALIAGLLAGRSYFNIHTANFPGGEIRGQLTSVPESATWLMMLSGFALVGHAIRPRRARLSVS